jgi:predicted aminopeptidase
VIAAWRGRGRCCVALLAAILVGSALTGCLHLPGYYGHLIGGHTKLMRAREPITQVLANPTTPDPIRHKLALSEPLRQFAQEQLLLPVEGAYSEYVSLDREWATWNLFAAPPLSMSPKQWCYPVVGCANYRGYFDQARAERDAQTLRKQGLEVYAGGAIAYSTLGWFDDPLTTPMLAGSDAWFAELLFHELVHRRFYLKGDTRFNESLATSVAREGVRRWLALGGASDSALKEAQDSMRRRDAAREHVLALVNEAREMLMSLYQSKQADSDKIALRDEIRAELRQAFALALAENPDLAGYQSWFDGPLNNAQLNTLADYEGWVVSFDVMLSGCDGEWSCFWQKVEQVAALPTEQRTAALQSYAWHR